MSIFRLLKAEILHRKLNFMFSLVAVLTAATLFVAGPTMLRGYQRDSKQRLTVMQNETTQTLVAMEEKAMRYIVEVPFETPCLWFSVTYIGA